MSAAPAPASPRGPHLPDPHGLLRFVWAQDAGGACDDALAEVTAGRKRTHGMWFVFPQLRGLGQSETAWRYGIASAAEARAYLAHPVLGPRLDRIARALLAHAGQQRASEIFGQTDAVKLCSSMTLFAHVSPPGSVFHHVLDAFSGGRDDGRTTTLLARPPLRRPPPLRRR